MWCTIKGEMGPLIPLGVKADLMDSHKHLRNGLYICLGERAYYIHGNKKDRIKSIRRKKKGVSIGSSAV